MTANIFLPFVFGADTHGRPRAGFLSVGFALNVNGG
jgi:hypothetical protein